MSRPVPGVGRIVSGVLVLLIALLVVSGLLGMVSAWLSYRAVDRLTGDVQPAASANAAILQDLTDAETGIRGWALSGTPSSLEPYERAIQRLPVHRKALRARLPALPGLRGEVDRMEAAADRWLTEYAAVRLARPGGVAAFDPTLFITGKQHFDSLRAAHGRIAAVLDEQAQHARETAVRRVRRTLVGLGIATVIGTVVATRRGRRLLEELRGPLGDLELMVVRLTAGDRTVRTRPRGPREVQLVARALNELADESARTREAEERFNAEVQALDAGRVDFVSNVSHELRTPLTTIAGYLELVEDEFAGRFTERHERMLEAGKRNVGRLRILIDDLLTLARAEDRSTDLEEIDVARLVGDAVDELRLAADRAGVRLATSVPERPVMALADRGQLLRAVTNVVGNAIKFSPAGSSVDVRVATAVRAGEPVVQVEVEDHGIGIPAAEIDSLGTRFFRASNAVAGEVPGTGLGLRIVQSILANHAGGVSVRSVEGEGTTVVLRLPWRRPRGADD